MIVHVTTLIVDFVASALVEESVSVKVRVSVFEFRRQSSVFEFSSQSRRRCSSFRHNRVVGVRVFVTIESSVFEFSSQSSRRCSSFRHNRVVGIRVFVTIETLSGLNVCDI